MTGNSYVLAVVIVAALVMVACSGGDEDGDEAPADASGDGFPREEVTIAVGEQPASPEDVGLGGEVEPRQRDTLDIDLATFGRRWNDAAADLGQDDLEISDWEVGYAQPRGDFTHELAGWLRLFGAFSYADGDLEYVVVEWEYSADIDGQQVASTWPVLISATSDVEDPGEIMGQLGLDAVDEDSLAAGLEATATHDGVAYEVFSDDIGGELEVRPANE